MCLGTNGCAFTPPSGREDYSLLIGVQERRGVAKGLLRSKRLSLTTRSQDSLFSQAAM